MTRSLGIRHRVCLKLTARTLSSLASCHDLMLTPHYIIKCCGTRISESLTSFPQVLAEQCIAMNPETRPTFSTVVEALLAMLLQQAEGGKVTPL